MNNLSATEEPFKNEYLGLGGRGLSAQVLSDEVDPTCDPLGPDNKIVLSTGAFAGMGLSCANRLSVGCKSPLTGGIKEANVGGTVGTYMSNHAIKMIIIEGKPRQDGLWVIRIDARGNVVLEDAKACKGMNNYQLVETLKAKYGNSIAVASIGGAGERMYKNSTVQITDNGTNYPCRAAARGGTGAVLGSKKIKAVVLEKAGKRYLPEYVNK
jgi:aldehyde:ferredoxin oxidoreductase